MPTVLEQEKISIQTTIRRYNRAMRNLLRRYQMIKRIVKELEGSEPQRIIDRDNGGEPFVTLTDSDIKAIPDEPEEEM